MMLRPPPPVPDVASGPGNASEPTLASAPGAARRGRLALAVAVASGLGLLSALGSSRSPTAEPKPIVEVPLAFPNTPCSAASSFYAERALATESRARAQLERYPFAPEVGLVAAQLFSEAAQCARSAGDVALATRLERALGSTRLRLTHDYDDHLGRLRWALATHREALARTEARFLSALLGQAAPQLRERLRAIELGLDRELAEDRQ